MDRRRKFMLGAAVIVGAVGYLIYSAARETSAYYLTMDEYLQRSGHLDGKPIRLAGRVSGGTVKWDPRSLDLSFQVEPIPPRPGVDEAAAGSAAPVAPVAPVVPAGIGAAARTLPVVYNGILPDMFADGRDVILEGKVVDGTFQAKTLLTTCPSKYEAGPSGAGDAEDASPPGANEARGRMAPPPAGAARAGAS